MEAYLLRSRLDSMCDSAQSAHDETNELHGIINKQENEIRKLKEQVHKMSCNQWKTYNTVNRLIKRIEDLEKKE